jgi:antitoxin VapB
MYASKSGDWGLVIDHILGSRVRPQYWKSWVRTDRPSGPEETMLVGGLAIWPWQLGRCALIAWLDICRGICQLESMVERSVKLFRNGRNQAVRIPREFELPGEDAVIRKEGQRLIIEPAPPKSLLAVLATLQTLEEEFPPIEGLPAEPVNL